MDVLSEIEIEALAVEAQGLSKRSRPSLVKIYLCLRQS